MYLRDSTFPQRKNQRKIMWEPALSHGHQITVWIKQHCPSWTVCFWNPVWFSFLVALPVAISTDFQGHSGNRISKRSFFIKCHWKINNANNQVNENGGGPQKGIVDVTRIRPAGSKEIACSFALPSGVIHGATTCAGKVFFAPADGISESVLIGNHCSVFLSRRHMKIE